MDLQWRLKLTEIQNKLQTGYWEQANIGEIRPSVEFKVGEPQIVVMQTDEPREIMNSDGEGCFYVFDCLHGGEEKSIVTSAKTLLIGLKKMKEETGLSGQTLKITKKQEKKKQMFHVEPNEESVS
jgi:hypothetical protein